MIDQVIRSGELTLFSVIDFFSNPMDYKDRCRDKIGISLTTYGVEKYFDWRERGGDCAWHIVLLTPISSLFPNMALF